MALTRRPLSLALALALSLGLGAGSCAKNSTTAPGVDSELLIRSAGPLGVAPPDLNQPWAWAVNSIDSVLFVDDIDSTRIEVTSFRLFERAATASGFAAVPGTVRFAAGNAYIHYTQAFPSAAYDFNIKDPPARSTLGKMYFIPNSPLHGHTEYFAAFTAGIRMEKGELRRDVFAFAFTTGDSIAPPVPASAAAALTR